MAASSELQPLMLNISSMATVQYQRQFIVDKNTLATSSDLQALMMDVCSITTVRYQRQFIVSRRSDRIQTSPYAFQVIAVVMKEACKQRKSCNEQKDR